MVPYHPPEIFDGVEKGMLCDDKFVALIITLHSQKKVGKTLTYDFEYSENIGKFVAVSSFFRLCL